MSTAATGGPGLGNLGEDRIQGSHETYEKGEVSSIGAIIGDVANDLSTLMRQEVALAKAEVRQSVRQTANGAAKLGVAAALATVGALVLTAFLVLLLGDLLDNYWLSALIVGLAFLIIGGLLAMSGMRKLRAVQLAPEATLATLKEDKAWVQEQIT